jgi:hypothetical protein
MINYNKANELSSFIHNNALIDGDSRTTQFMAYITIGTAQNNIDKAEIKVSATIDGSKDFGRISFLENRINSLIYPTDFDAKWQRFKNMGDEYLLITGTHPKKMIGKYTVEIRPLVGSLAQPPGSAPV